MGSATNRVHRRVHLLATNVRCTGSRCTKLRFPPRGTQIGLIPTLHHKQQPIGEERVASASHTNAHPRHSSLDLKPALGPVYKHTQGTMTDPR